MNAVLIPSPVYTEPDTLKRDGEFICRCGGTIGAKGYQCAFCTEECLSPIGGDK